MNTNTNTSASVVSATYTLAYGGMVFNGLTHDQLVRHQVRMDTAIPTVTTRLARDGWLYVESDAERFPHMLVRIDG